MHHVYPSNTNITHFPNYNSVPNGTDYCQAKQIAGGDFANERGYVDAGRACLNAWRVVAEVTSAGLDHRLSGRQRRMGVGEIGGELRCVQPAGGNITSFGQCPISIIAGPMLSRPLSERQHGQRVNRIS